MTMSRLVRRLLGNASGVAMTEFALGAPFLLMAGLYGVEMANYALTNMKVSQLALHIADNASRIGDTSTLQNRRIYESDINDVIYGAQMQGGKAIGLYDNGRVIISSVETRQSDGSQYIHWQRCRGAKNVNSSYGDEGDSLGTKGIGPVGDEVVAQQGDAVIFVQVNYTFQPMVAGMFFPNRDIHAIASFTVRDSRDLTQIYQRNPGKPDPVQSCAGIKKGAVSVGTNGAFS